MFNDCVYTPQELASFLLAMIGLSASLVAMFPQFVQNFNQYTNYQLKNVDGLSLGLLLFWTFGDVTNLVGAILTNQLPTQQLTAVFFAIIDISMVIQYFYYHTVYPQLVRNGYLPIAQFEEEVLDIETGSCDDDENEGDGDVQIEPSVVQDEIKNDPIPEKPNRKVSFSNLKDKHGKRTIHFDQLNTENSSSTLTSIAVGVAMLPGAAASIITMAATSCTYDPVLSESEKRFGYLMAWFSGLLYFCSRYSNLTRIPQVIKNYELKSVHGLSMYMFLLTIVGNVGYGLSVFLRLPKINMEFWLATFPYLVGSIGVLVFDLVTLVQAIIYKH